MQTFYPQQVYELLQDLHNHVPGATAGYMDSDELIQAIMLNDGLVEWVDYADGQMLEVTTKGLAELGRLDIPSSVEPPEPPTRYDRLVRLLADENQLYRLFDYLWENRHREVSYQELGRVTWTERGREVALFRAWEDHDDPATATISKALRRLKELLVTNETGVSLQYSGRQFRSYARLIVEDDAQ